jgi:hypothetical protein
LGIDIYLEWKGMTKGEREQQYKGFSLAYGYVGYLREAYHGEPYATKYFVEEAFEGPTQIKASTLKERLPRTLKIIEKRYKELYEVDRDMKEVEDVQKSYIDFVNLAEKKEEETGEPCWVLVSL